MKKLGIVLGLVVMLAGCSGGKETTTVCKVEEDVMKSEITLESKGDEIIKQEMISEVDISIYGDTYTEDEMQKMLEEVDEATYGDIKGVSFSIEVKDGIAKEKITIDYSKADMKELVDAGAVTKVDGKVPDIVSLEKSIKGFESEGATCKEK